MKDYTCIFPGNCLFQCFAPRAAKLPSEYILEPGQGLSIFNKNEGLNVVFQKIHVLVRPENIREVRVQGEKVHSR